MAGFKTQNEYAEQLRGMYDDIPKAVLAAIAVSVLTCGGDHIEEAKSLIANEWKTLHQQGIVPQAPRGEAKRIAENN